MSRKVSKRKTYYVVRDDEGTWITEDPGPDDQVMFSSTDKSEAETVLGLEEGR